MGWRNDLNKSLDNLNEALEALIFVISLIITSGIVCFWVADFSFNFFESIGYSNLSILVFLAIFPLFWLGSIIWISIRFFRRNKDKSLEGPFQREEEFFDVENSDIEDDPLTFWFWRMFWITIGKIPRRIGR